MRFVRTFLDTLEQARRMVKRPSWLTESPNYIWVIRERMRQVQSAKEQFVYQLEVSCLNGSLQTWAQDNEDLAGLNQADRWEALLAFCHVPKNVRRHMAIDQVILAALNHFAAPHGS